MKVGFVVTVHWSIKIRPKANLLIKRFLDSLFAFCYSDFNVYVVDNQSEFNEDSIYGPLTNGVLSSLQQSDRPIATVDRFPMVEGKCLSGFFFGLTKKHYNKFCFKKDEYFNKDNKHNGGDGKWGGQEGQWIQDASKGLIATLVGDCFIHHDKIRDWRVGKRLDEAGNL